MSFIDDTAASSNEEDEEYVDEEEESESEGSGSSGSSSSSSSHRDHHHHHHRRHHRTPCQDDPVSHTTKKKEEAADEEEKDEEEKDEPNVQWIFSRIVALKMSEVGCYEEGNRDFIELISLINKIRTHHEQIPDVVEPLSILMQTENMKSVFAHLKGIYEFIFQMHKFYAIPLNANTSRVKDSVLVDMMNTAIRKYTFFFSPSLESLYSHSFFSLL